MIKRYLAFARMRATSYNFASSFHSLMIGTLCNKFCDNSAQIFSKNKKFDRFFNIQIKSINSTDKFYPFVYDKT